MCCGELFLWLISATFEWLCGVRDKVELLRIKLCVEFVRVVFVSCKREVPNSGVKMLPLYSAVFACGSVVCGCYKYKTCVVGVYIRGYL